MNFTETVTLRHPSGRLEHLVSKSGEGREYFIIKTPEVGTGCLVRINSACFSGDIFGCDRCDCNWQLKRALHLIASSGNGLLVYDPWSDGRGHGSFLKVQAQVQAELLGISHAAAYASLGISPETRDYGYAVSILRHFGLKSVRLMTNNPGKIGSLLDSGIEASRVSLRHDDENLKNYYDWKAAELGHVY